MTNPDIVKQLTKQTEIKLKENIYPNYGLLGGNFGESLFLLMSDTPDYGAESIIRMLHTIYDRGTIATYCNGLAGLGTGLIWMEQQEIAEGVTENLKDIDYILLTAMRRMIASDNFDFLHGAIGIGLYFVDRLSTQHDVSSKAIKELVAAIDRKAIRNADGTLCMVYYTIDHEKKYNISLSHGLAGTILFLCRIIKSAVDDVTRNTAKELAKGMSGFLMAQLQDIRTYGCYFPTFPAYDDTSRKSRLGWCYGDLGVLMALYKTGIALENSRMSEDAIQMFSVEAKYRRNLRINMIHDACLCHGSGGIALIFKYLYDATKNHDFMDAFRYWLNVTKRFMSIDDGEVHFKMYNTTDKTWKAERCILEGDAGIGLLLNENYSLLNHILLID